MANLDPMIAADLPELIQIRHDLHAHPQLGYQETYASQVVQEFLRAIGIPFQANLAETGVVAWIDPPNVTPNHPALALRADMDALPIQEATGLPYQSQTPGLMHACGHDGHTAVLLGAARILWNLRTQLAHPVKLVFQPAEENGAGARRLTEAGVLSNRIGGRRVRAMFGLHGTPLLPIGMYATKSGPLLAGCCDFSIVIRGRGGHAAMPHLSADPVVAAATLITSAQTLVSRNCDPTRTAVVSMCGIQGGEATNVIPESVRVVGTIRALEDQTFEMIQGRMETLATGIAEGFACQAFVQFMPSYPAVMNDADVTEYALAVANSVCGPDRVVRIESPLMASEDFAYYSRVVPSSFGFIGLIPPGRESHPMLHTPQFDFTDAAIETGVRLMCSYSLQFDQFAKN